jgi:hypothetical protein
VTFYYSDDLSPLPVRAVTLAANNKSDPNLETGTYGLFSTCAHSMRASVVKNRDAYLFFVTRRDSRRVLTGYYHLRWYAPGALIRQPPDYALAADQIRFIHPGIPLDKLPRKAARVLGTPFRIFRRVDAAVAGALVSALKTRPNRTGDYLLEIGRLERFNRFRTGYRYPSWRREEAFDWRFAKEYLMVNTGAASQTVSTTSATDDWRCEVCDRVTHNKALLKRCPECGALGSLKAVAA